MFFSPLFKDSEEWLIPNKLNIEDYQIAIAEVENLMSQEELTLEEQTLLELWALLIEEYESKYYPIPEATPQDILLHLMEIRHIKQVVRILVSSKYIINLSDR